MRFSRKTKRVVYAGLLAFFVYTVEFAADSFLAFQQFARKWVVLLKEGESLGDAFTKSREYAATAPRRAPLFIHRVSAASPTCTITAPAAGALVRGSSTSVTANATGSAPLSIQFHLDGGNLNAADTSSPYGTTWNTTGASNGAHNLSCTTTNQYGETTTGASVAVTVDNSAPTVSVSAPTNGATVSGASVTVSATASDNDAVVGVQFKLDGANLGVEDTSSPYSISWNSTSAANGSHSITAVARDQAGNSTTSSAVTVTVSNDVTAPVRSNGAPSAALPAGTTQATLTLTTDENATCKYATSAGVAYASMTNTFSTTGTTSHSTLVTGLSNGNTYDYYVRCSDGSGNVNTNDYQITFSVNNPSGDTEAPTVPGNVVAVANSPIQAGVTWDASTDNTAVTGYRVYRGGTEIGTATGTSYTDNTATPGASYVYTVSAFDAAANESAQSAAANLTMPADSVAPTVPGSVVATANSPVQVGVTWNASTDAVGVAGYRVYRGGAEIGTATGTSYTDNTVSPGTAYAYTVTAYDAAANESAQSALSNVTTPTDSIAPTVPTGVVADAPLTTQVDLSWNASTDAVGVAGYRIYRGGTEIGTATGTSYSDTTVVATTSYSYAITAYDATGNESAQSSAVDITTPATDTPITIITEEPEAEVIEKPKRTIKASPKVVARGAVQTQFGRRFSKNARIALYFERPYGQGYYAPVYVTTDKYGKFSIEYKVRKPAGQYRWYAVDTKSGRKSKRQTYTVYEPKDSQKYEAARAKKASTQSSNGSTRSS